MIAPTHFCYDYLLFPESFMIWNYFKNGLRAMHKTHSFFQNTQLKYIAGDNHMQICTIPLILKCSFEYYVYIILVEMVDWCIRQVIYLQDDGE